MSAHECVRACVQLSVCLKCSRVADADKNVLLTTRFGGLDHFTYNLQCICSVLRFMLQDTSLHLTVAVPDEKRSAAFTASPLTDVAMSHVRIRACVHVWLCA